MKNLVGVLCGLFLIIAGSQIALAIAPAVFWVSEPLRPGETALMMGGALGAAPKVEVLRLADDPITSPATAAWAGNGQAMEVVQPGPTSLKFVLPNTFQNGVFAYRVNTPTGAVSGLLNRPTLWWAQGNVGAAASAGGWVRAFGVNLGWDDPGMPLPHPVTTLLLQGPTTVRLTAIEADPYSVRAALPADLPAGEYQLSVHNGCGGNAAWSAPLPITVEHPRTWPAQIYNVKTFGADGTGTKDDTVAIRAALAKADTAGGGVVYFPRGRYQLTDSLTIPRYTVLRGEGEELVNLIWLDTAKPPQALIQGSNSFGLEQFTLYASNYRHGITADQVTPDAGDVFLRHVRIRADRYRGHLKLAEIEERAQAVDKIFGGDTLQLGGRNVVITDCDILGSGRAFYLARMHGGYIANNTFYNGRWGWYCISGTDGLIFEQNHIIGADLTSTGGGINCLDNSSSSQNIYYAKNQLSLMLGWDREALTTDAGGGLYLGNVAQADGVQLTLAEAPGPGVPATGGRTWIGAGVFIHDGQGQGQFRRVVALNGAQVTLDRPWAIPPDATSVVSITMLQRHYLVLNNTFSDAGIAVQFYGTSIEHIVAGNRCERAGGYEAIGKPYGGYTLPPDKNPCVQPSWYCQFIGNTILEGNIYRGGANNNTDSGPSVVGIFGWPLANNRVWPMARGGVIRRNSLANNANIAVGGIENTPPSVRDVVIEGNQIAHADAGITLAGPTAGIYLRANLFDDVLNPLAGKGTKAAWLSAEQRVEIQRATSPVAKP